MPKHTPGGKAALLAAKTYRKKQNEKAKANRDRKAAPTGEGQ